MFKKLFIAHAQKKIDAQRPKINIKLGVELPLPSVNEIVKRSKSIAHIATLEAELKSKDDAYFPARTAELKAAVAEKMKTLTFVDKTDERKKINAMLNEFLPEAFALTREAAVRSLGIRHYDVQILGGMVLNNGGITEMSTGEGKTLVATTAVYLNALIGRGVHVITVNDYLAKRDSEWMGKVYTFLGLSVGVILHGISQSTRRENYARDITYGTNNEFGFDYLRDNMVTSQDQMVQRGHFMAVVDEVDSILVDEARTPLIISGAVDDFTDKYYTAMNIVKKLQGRKVMEKDEIDAKHQGIDLEEGTDYLADEKNHSVNVTEQGMQKVESLLGEKGAYDDVASQWPHFITQALRAKEFYRKDHHYIVKDGEVIIVDEFTGRLMPGRRWSDGLHQSVEAKEGIRIQEESQTLATVTLQNYFKMYVKLAGMTGTAYTEAGELKHTYDIDVVVIPTNRPLQRINSADKIYKTEQAKFRAVVTEIEAEHAKGRPILVGTASIEKSEILSDMLKRKGLQHQVLNAKQHEREAHIVAQAGRLGRIMIATNMAGRGTDILLGGNPEFLAKADLKVDGIEPGNPEFDAKFKELHDKYKVELAAEQIKVREAGGLHVIGTERHEARRIDNQLRGRSGRQGDPGSSVFFISLQDDLMRLFGSDRISFMMDKLGFEEDDVLEHPLINHSLETAQKRVEGQNFEIRKQLLDFDNVMNKQRTAVYDRRLKAIVGTDIKEEIMNLTEDSIYELVEPLFWDGETDVELEKEKVGSILHTRFELDKDAVKTEYLGEKDKELMVGRLFSAAQEKYAEREARLGAEHLRFLERMIYLQIIDARWKEHLLNLDALKEGIHLRGYAQKNPVDEYRHESYTAFMEMWRSVREGIVDFVFRAEPRPMQNFDGVFSKIRQVEKHEETDGFTALQQAQAAQHAAEQGAEAEDHSEMFAPAAPKQQTVVNEGERTGRNDPCPCGSGKKYKKCCGA